MAYDRVARDSSPVQECKMDRTSAECIACNGTREMQVRKGNHVAISSRQPGATESQSIVVVDVKKITWINCAYQLPAQLEGPV